MSERNRILFVGYTCLDLVFVCNHFPIEDSDQRVASNEWQRGGNAANNSTVLTQLLKCMSINDIEVEFFGTIAGDFASEFLIRDFHKNGIIIENIVKHNKTQTPTSSVIINKENGSRTILHFNKNLPLLTLEDFSKLNLDKYTLIHFEGLRNPLEIRKMISYIREKDVKREIRISLELEKDCNELKLLLAEDIDIFFIESAFAKLYGYQNSEETVEGIAKMVHSNALVVCPWAETGAKAFDNRYKILYSSTAFTPIEGVKDTLGAGDTFVASTLFALYLLNYELREAIVYGCQVAGAKCAKYGYKHLHKFQKYIE